MSCKYELTCRFLRVGDVIFIIDSENEYGDIVEAYHGQVVVITPGGSNHINPMAIVVPEDYESETDPVNEKASSILQIMECVVKSPFGINSIQETIIDECVHELFAKFLVNGRLRKIEDDEQPTLTDLMLVLSKRKEPEARELFYAYWQNCNFIQILGQGLIYTGKNVIPFGGEIPKNTKLYRLLTSNPKEKHEYEMERQREKTRLKKEEGQKKIAHFSLAVDKMRKKSGVEEANSEESTAYFFRCTAFDRQAGFMETYGKKGVKFAVEGHLATDYLINN